MDDRHGSLQQDRAEGSSILGYEPHIKGAEDQEGGGTPLSQTASPKNPVTGAYETKIFSVRSTQYAGSSEHPLQQYRSGWPSCAMWDPCVAGDRKPNSQIPGLWGGMAFCDLTPSPPPCKSRFGGDPNRARGRDSKRGSGDSDVTLACCVAGDEERTLLCLGGSIARAGVCMRLVRVELGGPGLHADDAVGDTEQTGAG